MANYPLDAWTAHKTDTGVVYYYNAVTGVSTYEKPLGFKGEVWTITVMLMLVMWDFKQNCLYSKTKSSILNNS